MLQHDCTLPKTTAKNIHSQIVYKTIKDNYKTCWQHDCSVPCFDILLCILLKTHFFIFLGIANNKGNRLMWKLQYLIISGYKLAVSVYVKGHSSVKLSTCKTSQ